ncbi:MAG TPA: NAD(+) synthase, partial [Fimbriimonas sp.]
MALPVLRAPGFNPESDEPLRINAPMVCSWLIKFLQDEVVRRRSMRHVVIGLSGGVDSAVVAYLCARAFGAENVHAFRMPYKVSSQESLDHAQLVIDDLGINERTIEITQMVDGYLASAEPEMTPQRVGNVCARCRMIVLFDQSAKLSGLPVGTGNKSERLFGYYTWHADDSPPINPLGDLFKT